MKKKEIAVQLTGVTKQYIVHHEKPTFSERLWQREKKKIFTALNDINLTIRKGEKIGVMGPNGAGKTTLLKVISRITTPNSGQVMTVGKVVSLIDLEAGFHLDLTGRDNVFLNGLVIGMKSQEISEKYKEITEFADIGEFIDMPLYTYSQGMKLRLGFAVAINSDPDILILDENIVVGDKNFQIKCQAKLKELFTQGKTVVMVSQLVEYLKKHCDRYIEIDEGRIVKDKKF